MAYLGNNPTSQSFISGTDYFNGTGSQTAFTLTRSINSVNDIEVVVNNVIQQPNSYTVSGTTLTLSAAPSSGTSNVYVRYLATNQQSFTVGNNTVGYNQLTSDMQSKFAMKNRIINGAMVISQRNGTSSVTPTDGQYVLDRYKFRLSQASKLTCQQNAGSITPPVGFSNYLGVTSSSAYSVGSGDYFVLVQDIEGFNTADLGFGTVNAKTVTLSFQVYSSLTGTFSGALRNSNADRSYPFTYTVSSANTWTTVSVTITGDAAGTWVGATNGTGLSVIFNLGCGSTFTSSAGSWQAGNYTGANSTVSVVGTSGATFYITGVQLEAGSSATGFEYVNYQTSLANCQRYCFVQSYVTGSSNYCSLGIGLNNGTTASALNYYFPVNMRITPSLTWSGSFSDLNSSGTGTVMTINTTRSGTTQALINVTYSAGSATVGTVCFLNVLNSTTWSAIFSSEL